MDKHLEQSNFSVSSLPPNPNIMGGGGSQNYFGNGSSGIEFDKMILNLSVDSTRSDLLNRIQVIKDHLQETDFETEMCLDVSSSFSLKWNVQRTGVKFYPYVLKTGDITLLLSSRKHDSSIPSARLEIGSVSCQNGLVSVYESVKLFLADNGFLVFSDSVSRVDLCVDAHGVSIQDKSLSLFDDERRISRSRCCDIFKKNRKVTGVQFGRGDIVLRIYDKVAELLLPENSEKLLFFRNKWGFFPEDCTRIEFQLRRKALKELGVNSFSDCVSSVESVWNYLTFIWFRHTSDVVDYENKHHSRSKTSFFWTVVQGFSRKSSAASRAVKTTVHKSMKLLTAQLRGILITLAAGMGHDSTDVFSIVSSCRNLVVNEISKAFKESDWDTLFKTRQRNTILTYDEPKFCPTPESVMFRGAFQSALFN